MFPLKNVISMLQSVGVRVIIIE